MRKTTTIFGLLIVLLATASSAVLAQPVITDGTNVPAIGYTSPVVSGPATVAPGAGGAAVTWDLSAISLSTVGTYLIETPTSTPVAATYPTGSYALSITPSGGSASYSYYIINGTGYSELANSVTTTAGSGRNYTPQPRKILKFPFNYNDTFTAPYATATTSGHDFFQYDGYGTLITPWATYTNVVRVKCTYASSFGYAYNWYTLNPLLNVLSYSSIPNSYTGLSAIPAGVQTISNANVSASFFPNPFTDKTTLKINSTTGFNNAVITITDVMGRISKQIPITDKETTINRNGLAAGSYFYNLRDNGEKIASGILIIQ